MTTQTEKLENKIANLVVWETYTIDTGTLQTKIGNIVSKQILKACQEAGLVFTDYSTDDAGNIILQGLEEIEI